MSSWITLIIKVLEWFGLKKKVEEQAEIIENQSDIIEVHETIGEIHKHDEKLDSDVEEKTDDLENKLDGQSESGQAEIIGGELDNYFEK
jgi:hypothetical protein